MKTVLRSLVDLVRAHPITVGLLMIISGPLGVLAVFWIYGLGLPCTKAEKTMELPGDHLLPETDRSMRLEMAITIDAPPEKVWPYLAQIGLRRAGFYSFSRLERLCGFHIFNTYEVVDEWQDMKPGEFIFYHQAGIGSQVVDVAPGRYFTSLSDSRRPPAARGAIAWKPPLGLHHFAWTWNFILVDNGDGTTRFVNRCDASWDPFDGWRKWAVILALGSPSFFMCRHMMGVIKKCAEGRMRPGAVDRALQTMAG